MPDASKKSLYLSLKNIYEIFAISAPTLVDATFGRVTKAACDDRLDRAMNSVIRNAGIELDIRGRDHLANGRTFLVMSNHQSLYDIPILFRVIGANLRMVTKSELFRIPVWGPALRESGFIEIDRSNRERAFASLAVAKQVLAAGTNVWIAPEGTRSRDGRLLPFKKGGFTLAMESGWPVLPVTLDGTRRVLAAKGVRSSHGIRVCVTVHRPIEPTVYATLRNGRDKLMSDVRAALAGGLAS